MRLELVGKLAGLVDVAQLGPAIERIGLVLLGCLVGQFPVLGERLCKEKVGRRRGDDDANRILGRVCRRFHQRWTEKLDEVLVAKDIGAQLDLMALCSQRI